MGTASLLGGGGWFCPPAGSWEGGGRRSWSVSYVPLMAPASTQRCRDRQGAARGTPVHKEGSEQLMQHASTQSSSGSDVGGR